MNTDKQIGIRDKVRVAVRIRPFSHKEYQEGDKNVVETAGAQLCLTIDSEKKKDPQQHRYAFDYVFPPEADQKMVFEKLGLPLIKQAFEGFNSTIFAYGQTGSGKTYTILNHSDDEESRGIVPRFSAELFSRIHALQADSSNRTFLVCCSLFEIYNEIIHDLLVPGKKSTAGLEIREQKGIGVYVKDLSELVVDSYEKIIALVNQGFLSRATAATKMNHASSRSHCVFTVKLHQRDEDDESNNTLCTMNLVDLAGSERPKDVGGDSHLLKEGANINKSLSALGNVINALSSQSTGQKKLFIPYRNSKLTRVLQDSLGGNSLCTMLANISPASTNADETLSTLNYARRAKMISVNAVKNDEASHVEKLNEEVELLREKLELTGVAAAPNLDGGSDDRVGSDSMQPDQAAKEKYEKQIQELQGFIKQTWEDKQALSSQREEERQRLLEEARSREDQLEKQRQRRLQILEEQGDLMQTLREAQTCNADLCAAWVEHLVSARALDLRLHSQVRAVLVCRDAVREDLESWWHVRERPEAFPHLCQASRKLESMSAELGTLLSMEVELSNALLAVLPHAERAITSCGKGEEVYAVLKLLVEQLHAYRRKVHVFLNEALGDLGIEQEFSRISEALGEDLEVAELPAETGGTLTPMGLAGFRLQDAQLSASSNSCAAPCGRLLHSGSYGGWCSQQAAQGEYLEVDVGCDTFIGGISTQGRTPLTGNWEQTRDLLRALLGDKELLSGEGLPTADRVYMRPPVRFVHDVTITLCKLFGILKDAFSLEQHDYTTLSSKEVKLDFFTKLIERTALASGADFQKLSAQDILSGRNTVGSGKLLQCLAYQALAVRDSNAGGLTMVEPQWTIEFSMEYQNGGVWKPITSSDGTPAIFPGNAESTSVHTCQFDSVYARRVRIKPLKWHGNPALRIELYGAQQQPSSNVCPFLCARLWRACDAVAKIKSRMEEAQRQAQLADEAERARQLDQAKIEEQGRKKLQIENIEMGGRLQELQQELHELRKLKAVADEWSAVAEAEKLQMQLEADRAKTLLEQVRADLHREKEISASREQEMAQLKSDNDNLVEQNSDLTNQVNIVTEERDAAHLREEDQFEQIVSLEAIVSTTEGYMHEKLIESEAEIKRLESRCVSPVPVTSDDDTADATTPNWKPAVKVNSEYDDSFDSDEEPAVATTKPWSPNKCGEKSLGATLESFRSCTLPETPRSAGYPFSQ